MQLAVVNESLADQASVDSCLANVGVTVSCDIQRIVSLDSSICKGGCRSSPWCHMCRWFSAME